MQTSLVRLDSTDSSFPVLVILSGKNAGRRYSLRGPLTVIGRSDLCDIQVNDDGIEPVHCVIALGTDGLFLRSFCSGKTFQNNQAFNSGALNDLDKLTLGTCLYEVRYQSWECRTSFSDPLWPERRHELLMGLQTQLHEGRLKYRQERQSDREEIAQQTQALIQYRDEVEEKESEVDVQRERLRHLRIRFLKRWKKHWSDQRGKLKSERDELNRDLFRFRKECATFEFHKSQFERNRDAEKQKLQELRDELAEQQEDFRQEQSLRTADLQKKQVELEEWSRRLAGQEAQMVSCRLQTEQRCARLRIEAEGLESRVVNNRAILVHLEQLRDVLRSQIRASQVDANAEGVEEKPRQPSALPEAEILPVLEQLADQRATLLEQFETLSSEREQWYGEHRKLTDELAMLAERLHEKEAELEERQRSLQRGEEHLRHSAEQVKNLKDQLELKITRQTNRELSIRNERQRAELDLACRTDRVERRENALAELFRRWSDRRRREISELRQEHARCMEQRQIWTEAVLVDEHKQLEKIDRQRALAEQALVLEQARQQLLDRVEKPLLAQRKLDRLQRHVRASFAKMERTLIDHAKNVITERNHLESLFGATLQRIEELQVRERSFASQLTEWETGQFMLVQKVESYRRQEMVWKNQEQLFREELQALRNEVDRLTDYLMQYGTDFVPLARAA